MNFIYSLREIKSAAVVPIGCQLFLEGSSFLFCSKNMKPWLETSADALVPGFEPVGEVLVLLLSVDRMKISRRCTGSSVVSLVL